MTASSEFGQRQRSLVPPPEIRSQLERQVMRDIDSLPAKHRRTRLLVALGTGLLGVALFLVLMPHRKPHPAANIDYIESVVIMDDHVFIWLEPANNKQGADHE